MSHKMYHLALKIISTIHVMFGGEINCDLYVGSPVSDLFNRLFSCDHIYLSYNTLGCGTIIYCNKSLTAQLT